MDDDTDDEYYMFAGLGTIVVILKSLFHLYIFLKTKLLFR